MRKLSELDDFCVIWRAKKKILHKDAKINLSLTDFLDNESDRWQTWDKNWAKQQLEVFLSAVSFKTYSRKVTSLMKISSNHGFFSGELSISYSIAVILIVEDCFL